MPLVRDQAGLLNFFSLKQKAKMEGTLLIKQKEEETTIEFYLKNSYRPLVSLKVDNTENKVMAINNFLELLKPEKEEVTHPKLSFLTLLGQLNIEVCRLKNPK